MNLFRKIPENKNYQDLINEDPETKFEYFISENELEDNGMKIETIQEWFSFYNEDIPQYTIMKQWCKDYLKNNGWSSLSDGDKDAIIELDLADSASAVPYLMSKGYSLDQSRDTLLMAFAKDHVKNIEACSIRMNDKYLYIIIGKHLNKSEAASFFNLTQNLSSAYERQALKGTIDSPGMGVGLFDFIESTVNTIYENVGLASQGFLTNSQDGNTEPLKIELMDWFRYGKKY